MDLKPVEALAVASQLGFVLGAAVLLGIVGGSFLDGRLGTSPLMLILGSILGMVAGIYSAAQMAKFLLDQFGRKKRTRGEE
jgi:F0F1-type ATP synthase assembly protein I